MLRRLALVLMVVVFTQAVMVPGGARATVMPVGTTGQTTLAQTMPASCGECLPPTHPGTNPDRMPVCHSLACAGPAAVLPTPAVVPARTRLRVAYRLPSPVRWTAASPAPDPLPPRPIVLV